MSALLNVGKTILTILESKVAMKVPKATEVRIYH